MVQKMLEVCEAKNGIKTNKLLHAGTDGHQRIWQNGEENPNTRGRESPSQRGKELENRWRKEKNCEKGVSEAVKQFGNGRFNGTKRPVELGKGKI